MAKKHRCKTCSRLISRRAGARGPMPSYCGLKCLPSYRSRLLDLDDRKCVCCGVKFSPKSSATEVCSNRCRSIMYRRKFRPSRKPCEACGKAFQPRSKRGRFCCSDCRINAQPKEWTDAKRTAYHRRRALKRAGRADRISPKVVFERDGWRCQICGCKVNRKAKWPHKRYPTLDHILPLSKGGLHVWENVQCACYACNMAKKAKTAGQQLRLIG